jgi:hypothetical protein
MTPSSWARPVARAFPKKHVIGQGTFVSTKPDRRPFLCFPAHTSHAKSGLEQRDSWCGRAAS